mgnify:FL=1
MNQETDLEKGFEALRQGKFILVYDNDDREGEIDMIIASEFVTPKSIATMRNDAGGLICNCISSKFCEKINLPFMVDIMEAATEKYPNLAELAPNDIPYDERSSFSIWVNHRKSFTGVTDHDRAMTISEMAKMFRDERFDEFGKTFRSPGHVCLLRGADGLVKNRRGHTEIGLALCEMAGVTPVCVVCEMMDGETGQATSIADARKYAEENGLVLLRGEDIINKYLEE